MASLSEIYVKKSTLETILKALNAKQGKEEGVKLTISLIRPDEQLRTKCECLRGANKRATRCKNSALLLCW